MDNPVHEHAEAAAQAHEGHKHAALLVAALAACLALSEQGAKHAEMRVEESSIGATDAWAQYQAKSTRATLSRDFADVLAALPAPDAASAARLAALQQRLRGDQGHYDAGPDGKAATAEHAHALEHERDGAMGRARGFDNAAAALELGIVLATASVIVDAAALLWVAVALGVGGVGLALAAL